MIQKKIRTLIVDDSAFMRRVIRQMLESSPDIEVVGAARDGHEGVDMALSLKPDVITMDVEMPRMNGIEAVERIMDQAPASIIMVSSLTKEGAKATIDALDRGAVDFISKNLTTSSLDMMKIQEELVEKVRAVGRKRHRPASAPRPSAAPKVEHVVSKKIFASQNVAIIAIGASTGGPKAVQEVLTNLPKLEMPVVISVHMPKAFTGAFAERLNALCKMPVKEAENGEPVRQGQIFLSPGGVQTRLRKKGFIDVHVSLSDDPKDAIYKPSVDVMMASVAECYPGRALGVILTGMGHDGREGMRLIRDKGGKTLAQNEETCTVYGMPRAVIEAGLADKIMPLDKIAAEIVNMI